MARLTMLARVSDALLLCASVDDHDSEDYTKMAKQIFRHLGPHSPLKCSVESEAGVYHYIIEKNVCFLVLCDRSYPRKLAFSYLVDLQREFDTLYGREVEGFTRPYAAIKFDQFIQRTRRGYQDTRTHRNLQRLSEDLKEVQDAMKSTITEVIGRGERLDHVAGLSSALHIESRKYAASAKQLNFRAWLRTYGPVMGVIVLVALILFIRLY